MRIRALFISVMLLAGVLLSAPGHAADQTGSVSCKARMAASVEGKALPPEGALIVIDASGSFIVECNVPMEIDCLIDDASVEVILNDVDEDTLIVRGSGQGTVILRCGPPSPETDPPSESTPDCNVTFGGWGTLGTGSTASFGGVANTQADEDPQGQQQYQDEDGFRLHSTELVALVCWRDTGHAAIFGTGEVQGEGAEYRIDVTDRLEPGSSDAFRLRTDTGYDSGELPLSGGNVQLHGESEQGGRKDSAVGGGLATDGTGFGFSAHSDPAGLDPHGRITTKITSGGVVLGEISAAVTCLSVDDNRATIGGRIEQSNAAGGGQVRGLEEGKGILLFVEDNGEPNGDTAVDRLGFESRWRPPSSCRFFYIGRNQLDKGNLKVHDEPT